MSNIKAVGVMRPTDFVIMDTDIILSPQIRDLVVSVNLWFYRKALPNRTVVELLSGNFKIAKMHLNEANTVTTGVGQYVKLADNQKLHLDSDDTGLELIHDTLPGLLHNQTGLTPNATALDSYSGQLSYAELQNAIEAVALQLSEIGVGPAVRIGLHCEISKDAIIHILAIMRLGAVAVPVDPHHPEARRLVMLREASVAMVIGDCSDNSLSWAASEFKTVGLFIASVDNVRQLDHSNTAKPEADAFVGFTSGSTGKPKGIVQTHEGIVTMGKALARGLNIDSSSRVAQISPYIFDVAMMEMAMTFVTGATLCIMRQQTLIMPEPGELAGYLTQFKVTHITLSPTMLKTMEPDTIPTVRVLSTMGESLDRSAVQKWYTRPNLLFCQLWGCTEATILQSITLPIIQDHSPNNIGFALGDVCRLWVVDPDNVDRLMPDGESGELVVEGRALARGYIRRPEETAKVFLARAKWQDNASKGRVYRTGDLAQKEPDGSIRFLGRNDGQMNRYGERVELGEIDFHIEQHQPTQTADCFVDYHSESRTIVGFVCGAKDAQKAEFSLLPWHQSVVDKSQMSELSGKLLKQGDLSDYMVPNTWLPITSRPLTVSNKTDRIALRQLMDTLSDDQRAEYRVSEHTG